MPHWPLIGTTFTYDTTYTNLVQGVSGCGGSWSAADAVCNLFLRPFVPFCCSRDRISDAAQNGIPVPVRFRDAGQVKDDRQCMQAAFAPLITALLRAEIRQGLRRDHPESGPPSPRHILMPCQSRF